MIWDYFCFEMSGAEPMEVTLKDCCVTVAASPGNNVNVHRHSCMMTNTGPCTRASWRISDYVSFESLKNVFKVTDIIITHYLTKENVSIRTTPSTKRWLIFSKILFWFKHLFILRTNQMWISADDTSHLILIDKNTGELLVWNHLK